MEFVETKANWGAALRFGSEGLTGLGNLVLAVAFGGSPFRTAL